MGRKRVPLPGLSIELLHMLRNDMGSEMNATALMAEVFREHLVHEGWRVLPPIHHRKPKPDERQIEMFDE